VTLVRDSLTKTSSRSRSRSHEEPSTSPQNWSVLTFVIQSSLCDDELQRKLREYQRNCHLPGTCNKPVIVFRCLFDVHPSAAM